MQRLMELDVVGQQRPQAVPVPLVEQLDITRRPSGRRPRVRKRASMHMRREIDALTIYEREIEAEIISRIVASWPRLK